MAALGAVVGVATPAIGALVDVAQRLLGRPLTAEARTIERLGLGGLDAGGIRRVVEHGFG
jgi:hypothetical protein